MEGGDRGGEGAGALEHLQGAGLGRGFLVGQEHRLQPWEVWRVEAARLKGSFPGQQRRP